MININGKSYQGNSVIIRNGKVTIDGKSVEDVPDNTMTIKVEGTLTSLETDLSVNCEDVEGNVTAGGSVNCASVQGDVKAGGSVNCDVVAGSVIAGGSVNRG